MSDFNITYKKLVDFLESNGILLKKNEAYSFNSMINKGKEIANFSFLLKKLIVEDFLPLNELLYATNVLLQLGETISPRDFLTIFNKSISVKLESEGKKELLLQNNEVLIGEIVGVFTSLTLISDKQDETISSLLNKYKWYRDYLDPLGLLRDESS